MYYCTLFYYDVKGVMDDRHGHLGQRHMGDLVLCEFSLVSTIVRSNVDLRDNHRGGERRERERERERVKLHGCFNLEGHVTIALYLTH